MKQDQQIYAHSLEHGDEGAWEPLSHHLSNVGQRAAQFASHFGAAPLAEAMGRLHDIGKMSRAYQRYIRQSEGEGAAKGPDHSTAGARVAVSQFGQFGRLMGFGIAGHHGGLMDGTRLTERVQHKVLEDFSGWEDHAGALPTLDDLKAMEFLRRPNGIEPNFTPAFFTRMAFSCLIDADFLETERFYAGTQTPERGGELEQRHLDAVRTTMAKFRKADTKLNRLRSRILDHANAKAELPPGLFTLTVPTGGGKTLASLSFALEHALRHGLRRVVYVIPFTSIIEQTAQVFRETAGLGDSVLEHHSSFDWDEKAPPTGNDSEGEGAAGMAKLRRDAENWDAPIIVTTAVQFFESLFTARTSKARKLHNLAKSVIVLDEAQSISIHLLRPCLAAIDELAKNYGASVILCTATQPALRVQDKALPQTDLMKRDDVWQGLDIPAERELAPNPSELYKQLKRVSVEWRQQPIEDVEITARFAGQDRMLCIVNSRAHAVDLFTAVREQGQEGATHLTTLMCARHRRDVLADVRRNLAQGNPVRLIATSLIEAGVDVDFPEVWRAATGLASIAQAAGRCNREGRLDGLGRTVVFEPAGRKTPPAVEAFYGPARDVLRSAEDVLGLSAIHKYYTSLYWRQGHEALDNAKLAGERVEILKDIRDTARRMDFPFARIASAFRLIDDVMAPVIIPFDDDARVAIHALRHAPFPPAGVQRKLQQYVVPVPPKARQRMMDCGAVQLIRPDQFGDRFAVLEAVDL